MRGMWLSDDAERAARLSAGAILDVAKVDPILAAYASSRQEIQAIWMFGSQVEGNARTTSDLDIALLLQPRPVSVEEPTYRAERERELEALAGLPVHVVLLSSNLPLALLWSIVRHPHVSYEREPGSAAAVGSYFRGLCRDQWPRLERRWARTDQWLKGLESHAAAGPR